MKLKSMTVAMICLLSVGCTDYDGTAKTLERQGYSEISVVGWAPFSCSENDAFRTSFRAKAPNGETVTGAVCAGFFKGNTLRLD